MVTEDLLLWLYLAAAVLMIVHDVSIVRMSS